MAKGYINFSFITILVTCAFFSLSPRKFDHIDLGVYYKYSKSLVEDGNLNLAAQRSKDIEKYDLVPIKTQTGYDPDFHPHGSSAISFIPHLLLSKFLGDKEQQAGISLLFFILIMFLLKYFKGYLDTLHASNFMFLAFILSSPVPFYLIQQNGNMSLFSFFFPILYISQILHKEIDASKYLYFVALFIVAVIIKTETIFYAPLLLFLPKKQKLLAKENLYPAIILIALVIAFLINNIIQYGEVFFSYGGVSTSRYVLFENLFAPIHGVLWLSPSYLLSYIFIVLMWVNKNLSTQEKVLAVIPVVKLVAESFAMSSGTHLGGRLYLMDFPVFIYFFLKYLSLTTKTRAISIFLILNIIWVVINTLIYSKLSPNGAIEDYFNSRHNYLLFLSDFISNTYKNFNILYFIVATSITSTLIYFARLSSISIKRITSAFLLLYVVVTLLNISNRSQDECRDCIVATKVESLFFNENFFSFYEAINYFSAQKDPKGVNQTKEHAKEYFNKASRDANIPKRHLEAILNY